jgi:hypothetical protein
VLWLPPFFVWRSFPVWFYFLTPAVITIPPRTVMLVGLSYIRSFHPSWWLFLSIPACVIDKTSSYKLTPCRARTPRSITVFTTARQRSLSWASGIHSTAPANLPKIHSNPIFPSMPRSSEWSLSLGLSHQNPLHFLSSPMRATCPAHLILLDLIIILCPFSATLLPSDLFTH